VCVAKGLFSNIFYLDLCSGGFNFSGFGFWVIWLFE